MLTYGVRFTGSVAVPTIDKVFAEFDDASAISNAGDTLVSLHPVYYTAYVHQQLKACNIETRQEEVQYDYIATIRTSVEYRHKKEK